LGRDEVRVGEVLEQEMPGRAVGRLRLEATRQQAGRGCRRNVRVEGDLAPATVHRRARAVGQAGLEIEVPGRALCGAVIVELQAMEARQHRREGVDHPRRNDAATTERFRLTQDRGEIVRVGLRRGVRCHAGSF
jgi:hypothetical protein